MVFFIMNKTVLTVLSLLTLILIASFTEAGHKGTPYGDFCGKCSKYGVCKDFISVEESSEAVKSYFDDTEIDIGRVLGKGRFLKIELIKDKELYDVILFDRKTGRIRSIY
jgi:hypothetical protein